MSAPTIHANCVVIGEAGVLIRGVSGAGKSSFSAELIERAQRLGRFARLVADDRVRLEARHYRLIASVPAEIAGLIERRGLGVQAVPYRVAAVVRLVVDLEISVDRMPQDAETSCVVNGVSLPRLGLARGAPDGAALTLLRLQTIPLGAECCETALAFAPQDGKMKDVIEITSNSRSDRARAACGGPPSERNEFCAETA